MDESTPAASAAPERFGRYVLLEMIGRGGMAEVYRSVATGLEGFQRVFVIKRILKEKSASKEFVEMFVNEARISALLNHQNIVQIYDFGQIEGSYFLAMEYLRGKDLLSTLRQLRASGKLMAPELAAFIAQQVANGLAHAHNLSQGGRVLDLVHRDVSPSNIMLLRGGGVKLLDFGIAKAAMEANADQNTQVGLVKGKLSYASPEQIKAQPIDRRSDVFALGVVLWECLTGKRLFYDKNDYQTMRNVLDRPVPPPSLQRPDVPPALDFIVVRALERDPDRRYPTAKMMSDELSNFLEEARFSPSAVSHMLDDLFGEDTGESDAPPAPAAEIVAQPSSVVTVDDKPAVKSGSAGTPGGELSGYAVVSSVRRVLATTKTHKVPWATAVIGVAAVAAGLILLARAAGVGAVDHAASAVAAVPPISIGSPSLAPPAPPAAPPVEPAPTLAATKPAVAEVAATVTAKIDSDPAGADIKGPDGTVLGVTPAVISLDRSDKTVTLTVSKSGYVPARAAIVPDRDASATVNLRAVTRAPAPARPARPKAAPAARPASDGKVREGLSVDPFADDGTKEPE